MRAFLLGLASLGLALVATDRAAAWGEAHPKPPLSACDLYEARCGWHPCLKWLCHKRNPPPRVAPATNLQTPPPPPTGTLVYPNHPFARSPRDYFMED